MIPWQVVTISTDGEIMTNRRKAMEKYIKTSPTNPSVPFG